MRFGEFLKLVFKDLRAVGVQAALLIALSVVIPVIDIVAPGVLGRALAVLVSQQEASQSSTIVINLLIAFLAMNVLKALLTALQLRAGFKLDANVLASMRARLMNAILRSPSGLGAGQMSSMSLHLQAVSSFWNSMLWESISSVLFLLGTAVVLLLLDWRLALVSFLPVPFVLGLVLFLAPRFRQSLSSYLSGVDALGRELTEAHENREFIQVSQIEERIRVQFDRHNQHAKSAAKNVGFWTATYAPIFDFIASLATVVLILFYAVFLFGDSVTNETFLTFFVYLAYFYRPLYSVSALNENWQKTFEAYKALEMIYSHDDASRCVSERVLKPTDKNEAIHPTSKSGINFEGVSFGYVGGDSILRSLNVEIPANKRIGIMGANGQGKSTLLKITMGLLKPTKGRILYGHESPKFAYMPQTVFLHSGSVISNLLMIHPEFHDGMSDNRRDLVIKDIMDIGNRIGVVGKLKAVELDANLFRYNQVSLSGGQKQLIGLWRFAVQSQFADYLVMDEPDAYLDIEGLNHVLPKVFEFSNGKTMLIVSHSARIIEQCDVLFSLSEGQLLSR
jgi:ABC-type multidrug transport system fused ATPase/permease subunit